MRRVFSRSAIGLVVLILSCTADGGPVGIDQDLLTTANAPSTPVVILLGTAGGIATFQATWTGTAPFAWDARPNVKANSPKQRMEPYATTSTTFTMVQQPFAYNGVFKVWEILAPGVYSPPGGAQAVWTVPALASAPSAVSDAYGVLMGGTLNVPAGTGLLFNDNLGSPAATLFSFGGGSLGGAVTDNAAGASVALAGGTLTVNGDGSLDVIAPTVPGAHTFVYRITNTAGSSDATVTINVGAVVAPTATSDGPYDVDVAASLGVGAGVGPPNGLLVNDALGTPVATLTSFGGGSLGGVVTDNPGGASVGLAGGTLTVNGDGSFDLTTPTVPGTYTFMYRLTNTGGTSDATVTINVNAIAPTAADDGLYTVQEGATLNVGAGAGPPDGLLVNDALGNPAATLTSFGGGSLGGAVTDNAAGASVALAGGTLTVNGDGSFDLVTPTVPGTYAFMYRLTNAGGTSDATVTIDVNAVLSTPVVILLGTAGGIATFQATWTGTAPFAWDARPNVKANSPKQRMEPYATTSTTFTMVQQAFAYDGVFKVWEILAPGVYSPSGGLATPWTVPAPGTAPTATADGPYDVDENATLNVGAGAGPPDGLLVNDALGTPAATLTSFGGGSLGGAVTDNASGASVALAGGTLTVNGDGSFDLTSPTVVGTYTFMYRITNTAGTSDATVTINVNLVAVAPTATADGPYDVDEGATLNVGAGAGPPDGLLVNDALGNPAATLTSFGGGSLGGAVTDNAPGASVALAGGTLTVNGDGSFDLVTPTVAGTYQFMYRITNTSGTSDATVTINVNAVATAPTATADGPYDVDENATLNVGAGAGPPDGLLVNDALGTPAATLTSFGGGSLGGTVTDNAAFASVALAGGSLSVNGDGSFKLSSPTVVGTYTFMYRITNTSGTSDATVTINVNAVGVAPTATADGPYDVAQGATLNVAAGAGPPDGLLVNDALGNPAATLTSFGAGHLGGAVTDNAAGASVALAGGTLTVNGDGSFDLVAPTVVGSYAFFYRLTNTSGTSDAQVIINVNTAGVAPTATADGPYDVDENATLNVAAGAGPPDGLLVNDALGTPAATLTSFGGGSLGGAVTDNAAGASVALAGGTLTVNGDGSFDLVTPTVVGTYTFMYRLTNIAGTSDATVTINVNAVVPPVSATDDNYTATGNIGIEVPDGGSDVLGNDLGIGLSVTQVQGSGANLGTPTATTAGGSVTLQANGSFTYDPPAGVEGGDSFTYQMTDGVTTDDGTVNLTMSGMIWFIDNTATGTDAGSFTDPFQTLSSFNTANVAGGGTDPKDNHTVSLATGSYVEADGINLRDGQVLIGNGVQLDNFFVANPLSSPAYQTYAGSAGTSPSIATGGGNGIDLASSNTIRGLDIGNTTSSAFGVSGTAVGSPTIADVGVSGSGGALNIVGSGNLSGVTFDDLSSSSSSAHGINLDGVTGTMTVTGASSGIAGSTDEAVRVANGSVSLSYPGNINNTTRGILLVSNSGTVSFSGTLTISTPALPAFRALNSGTVNATGPGSTLSTGPGTALSILSTTIGGSGLTFQSISANGGSVPGIILNNAGSGGLTVTGTGSTNGSGGLIQNKTNRGIEIISSDNVSIDNMQLTNASTTNGGTCTGLDNSGCNAAIYLSSVSGAHFDNVDISGTTAQQGINGLNVTGFTLGAGSTIMGAGDQVNEGGVRMFDLDGTVLVDGTFITGSAERNFFVTNNFGSAKTLDVTVQNTTMNNTGATFGADGLEIELLNNTTMNMSVTGSVFSGNRTNGIQVISAGNSVTNSLNITGSQIDPGTGVGKAIDLNTNNSGTMNFNVTGNTKLWAENGNVVNVSAFVNSSISGRVNNNSIRVAANSGSGGSGVNVSAEEQADIVIEIDNNTILNAFNDAGVWADSKAGVGGTAGRLDATISNNSIELAAAGFGFGVVTRAINDNTTCANVVSNTINDLTGFAIVWEARYSNSGSTLVLPGLAGGAASTTVPALWNANGNTPTSPTSFINPSGSGTVTSGTCAVPTHP